jgi:uncharacterized protein (DUF302 family)
VLRASSKAIAATGLALLALGSVAVAPAAETEGADVVQVFTAEDTDYETVKFFLTEAIRNKGLIISGTLHVQDMLERTAEDLGHSEGPYVKAESLEFCSADLSHKMIAAHPGNLTVCPFTIAVYTLKAEPETVYLTYQKPVLAGAATTVEQEIIDLLDGVIAEVTEF